MSRAAMAAHQPVIRLIADQLAAWGWAVSAEPVSFQIK